MTHIRKSFSEDTVFPFHFVYRDTKSPQAELPDHLHDRCELVYVYSGKGTFFINRTFYDMGAGDLFVIPGNTIHRATPDADHPVTSTAVFFASGFAQTSSLGDSYSGLHIFDLARKRKHYKVDLTEPLRGKIENMLSEINAELESKAAGYRHAIRLQLQSLMLSLNRLVLSAEPAAAADVQIGPQWMKEILHYIDSHHAEPGVSLSALAQKVSVTPAHFSRVFKQLTGMNVTDYVNAKRIVLAKELLLGTSESIDTIAGRCGFESLPYFHRVFKALSGITPGTFRRVGLAPYSPSPPI
ncbi:AraC family transcriptional regulator [Gordoniibacillus kamchatkensis]|uniref:AraC family transcriptional regulator n=1 Tax=Gordoniibacillus kamchatkensis TaxID=1590651 RepID=A0ABR5AKN5_9BACL|nr:AraC family transcriptional regulator [Paenibacillus sp. VKM B-2647]KIL41482.1 AraC family transcriptional regulator [Paenibacillus sp. VKM B-2647]